MKNTSISLFRQILDLVPKHEFEKIIMKRRVQVLLVKNEKEHAWAINSRNID